jgi:hypothetical protein
MHSELSLGDLHMREPVLLVVEEAVPSHGWLSGAHLVQVVARGADSELVEGLSLGELRVARVIAEEELLVRYALPGLQGAVGLLVA